MNKLNLTIAALALAALSGCSVTNIEKNGLKEPNGNIRVNDLAIQGVVPVNFSYNTTDQECSEIEFLKSTTGRRVNGVRVDNIYEIHWNHIENHSKVLGISSPKQYTCNFWGLGIQYNVGVAMPAPAPQAMPIQQRTAAPVPAQPTAYQPAQQPQATQVQATPLQRTAPATTAPAVAPTATVDDSWD